MILSRLKKTESFNRGMILSVLFNIIAKGILFLLTVLIAFFFGSDIRTDIYFFVYSTMVLFAGFINAVDTAVLVPESMRIREKEGDHSAMAFLNRFFRIYLLIGIVFSVLMYFFGTSIFSAISRFPKEEVLRYKDYFLLGSLGFAFLLLTNFLNAVLTSLKFFTVPMVISAINSCLAIGGILLLQSRYDVLSVFMGTIAAYIINLFLLLLLMKRNADWNFFTKSTAVEKKIKSNILFAELGQLATLASNFLPLYLLSGFAAGNISLMNYGKNIADIPNTLVTAQITGVSGIELNEQAAREDAGGMKNTFQQTGRLLLFILIPFAAYLFVFAEPIVRLFYQRGNFNEESVTGAARFLQLFAVTGFIIGINALVSRVFMALQAIRQAFIYQVLINVLLIGLIWFLTREYGADGYPYALIIGYAINFVLMFFICRQLKVNINYAGLFPHTALLLLINGAIAAGFYFALPYLHMGALAQLLVGFFVYLILLLIINHLLRLNPVPGQVLNYVRQRFF